MLLFWDEEHHLPTDSIECLFIAKYHGVDGLPFVPHVTSISSPIVLRKIAAGQEVWFRTNAITSTATAIVCTIRASEIWPIFKTVANDAELLFRLGETFASSLRFYPNHFSWNHTFSFQSTKTKHFWRLTCELQITRYGEDFKSDLAKYGVCALNRSHVYVNFLSSLIILCSNSWPKTQHWTITNIHLVP